MNDLKITFVGLPGRGKTLAAEICERALKESGAFKIKLLKREKPTQIYAEVILHQSHYRR